MSDDGLDHGHTDSDAEGESASDDDMFSDGPHTQVRLPCISTHAQSLYCMFRDIYQAMARVAKIRANLFSDRYQCATGSL